MSTIDFIMPDIGEGLSEAEIVKWCVAEGEAVERDQTVVEVETDKSIVGIPAPTDGVIEKCLVPEGDTVAIGAALFRFVPSGSAAVSRRDLPSPIEPTPRHAAVTADSVASPAEISPAPSGTRVLASPATRKRALDLGVDLSAIVGSGPHGRVTKDDVIGASQRSGEQRRVPAAATDDDVSVGANRVVPLRGLRRQIARTMTASWQSVPHITDVREIDASGLNAARDVLRRHADADGPKLTYLPLLVKATAIALRKNPVFNASVDMDAEQITYHDRINIGIATATPDGLIVPVLKDADRLAVSEIASGIDRLSSRARERVSRPDELNEGTFTISNFGSFGGWIATPIIRPPESAIAGFGRIKDQVVAVDGQVVIRPTLPLCVSADHRLIDGDAMGAFLNTMTELLTEPILMIGGV